LKFPEIVNGKGATENQLIYLKILQQKGGGTVLEQRFFEPLKHIKIWPRFNYLFYSEHLSTRSNV